MMLKKMIFTFIAGIVLAASHANAAVVTGSSALLTKDDVTQLGSWLGQSVDLTNIYTKQAGNTSFDFHAAVDGKGATFVVMQVTDQNSGITGLVGGYNPQSWNSNEGYSYSYDVNSRDAFLFNLSTDTVFGQKDISNYNYWYWYDQGVYQTYNSSYYGPTFGGGHDLYVADDLTYAYSNLWSYASTNGAGNLLGNGANNYSWQVAGLEVFNMAPARNEVPEPASLALFAIALGGLAAARSKRFN